MKESKKRLGSQLTSQLRSPGCWHGIKCFDSEHVNVDSKIVGQVRDTSSSTLVAQFGLAFASLLPLPPILFHQ